MEETKKTNRKYKPKTGIVSTQLPLETRARLAAYCDSQSDGLAVLTPCRLLRRLVEAHLDQVDQIKSDALNS